METLRLRVYRILCLMMALMILISAAVLPPARAVVLADDLVAAGAVVVIGAIWIASGAEFNSTDDLYRAARHVYDNVVAGAPELLSEVTKIARQWLSADGTIVQRCGVVVSSALWEAVCGTPSQSLNDLYYHKVQINYDDISKYDEYGLKNNSTPYDILISDGVTWRVSYTDGNSYSVYRNGSVYKSGTFGYSSVSYPYITFFLYYDSDLSVRVVQTDGSTYSNGNLVIPGGANSVFRFYYSDYPLTLYFGNSGAAAPSGTIAEPQDIAVTLPQATPDYDEEGKVVYPDIPLDAPSYRTNTADIPTDAALPTDTVIDLSTGAEITEATDVPDVPATGELPSASDLTLPDLIISKFPFCIPFDVYNMFALLAADPVEPVFVIPVQIGSLVDETITIDFSQFSQIIAIVRWGEYACFVAGLALVTRNYIKW